MRITDERIYLESGRRSQKTISRKRRVGEEDRRRRPRNIDEEVVMKIYGPMIEKWAFRESRKVFIDLPRSLGPRIRCSGK